MKVLVSGASFAGLSTAYWMQRLGHEVTVVEIGPGLRLGGTAVNLRGNTIALCERMGILEQVKANRLSLERSEFKNADDVTERLMVVRNPGEPLSEDDFEIERNALLGILFDLVKDKAEVVFGDGIKALAETPGGVAVTFQRGAARTFDLVCGCEGMRSAVRRMWFGPDSDFTLFLEQYFSISIVDTLLIPRNTVQMFNVPGKVIMLNAYKNKTDIIFGFVSEKEIPYDHRDEAQQRRIITEQFAGAGWRSAELLKEISKAESFYFDKLAQIRMPSWSRGRVVLVGDSGYCPSPAAGMGGSLAIDGAAALGDAMAAHPTDLPRAFREYDEKLRPFIDEVQAGAVKFGLEMLVPRTEEAIRARNVSSGNAF